VSEQSPARVIGRPFQPGQGGRKLGARNKLGEAFVKALFEDFDVHGVATIEQVRLNDPPAYLRVIAGLLPKQITGEDGETLFTGITVSFVSPENR
jgi:hypothetical protein